MSYNEIRVKRIEFLSAISGTWLSDGNTVTIMFTISEHISSTGDGFQVMDCKKSEVDGFEEPYHLNFIWTKAVLRVSYEGKPCVVCFIDDKNNIGFFQSILTCNECKDDDLLIRFKKIIQ